LTARHSRATLALPRNGERLSVHEFFTVGADEAARIWRAVKGGVRFQNVPHDPAGAQGRGRNFPYPKSYKGVGANGRIAVR